MKSDTVNAMIIVGLLVIALVVLLNSPMRREGLTYLNQYEKQDYYHENPSIYPNPYSFTTANFKLRRDLSADRII